MAKSKKRRKKKINLPVKLKPENYIRKMGRKLPIHECRIDEGWQETGKVQVIVSRRKANGLLIVGFYLVDLWCLGLKDTFFREEIDLYEYQDLIDLLEDQRDIKSIKCEPALAFNVIYGGIEYGEDNGFDPPRDFKVTEYLLDDVESFPFMEIEFGFQGRPHFNPGPDDDIDRILKVLNKKLGLGNYGVSFYDDELPTEGFFDLESHLPSVEIDLKQATIGAPAAHMAYMLQVGIARHILNDYRGDLSELLEFGYEEEYVEETAEIICAELEESAELEGEEFEATDEFYEEMLEMVAFMLDKIIQTGDVKFLLRKDYEPIPVTKTKEELGKMTPEEIMAYENYLMSFKSSGKREELLFMRLARNVMFDLTQDGKVERIDEALREKLLSEFFLKLGEIISDNEFVEENREYLTYITDQVIAEYPTLRSLES